MPAVFLKVVAILYVGPGNVFRSCVHEVLRGRKVGRLKGAPHGSVLGLGHAVRVVGAA